ncbi:hypothetical protein PR048_028029 [Dryococelus australis]|uniref:Uncharacterized protein n=1 Tax=Dryococelus australis TaxID=614101 RepID=A0ABQ9GI44_9NEOP|nr:hypothetical protein PR048_028029 [Dryococelus australis]
MPLVSGFSRGSPVSPIPSFRRRSIFTSSTLIGSQDLAFKSRPNNFSLGDKKSRVLYNKGVGTLGREVAKEWGNTGKEGGRAKKFSMLDPIAWTSARRKTEKKRRERKREKEHMRKESGKTEKRHREREKIQRKREDTEKERRYRERERGDRNKRGERGTYKHNSEGQRTGSVKRKPFLKALGQHALLVRTTQRRTPGHSRTRYSRNTTRPTATDTDGQPAAASPASSSWLCLSPRAHQNYCRSSIHAFLIPSDVARSRMTPHPTPTQKKKPSHPPPSPRDWHISHFRSVSLLVRTTNVLLLPRTVRSSSSSRGHLAVGHQLFIKYACSPTTRSVAKAKQWSTCQAPLKHFEIRDIRRARWPRNWTASVNPSSRKPLIQRFSQRQTLVWGCCIVFKYNIRLHVFQVRDHEFG